MTTATVLPLLTYVESHVTAMYNATSETETSNASHRQILVEKRHY